MSRRNQCGYVTGSAPAEGLNLALHSEFVPLWAKHISQQCQNSGNSGVWKLEGNQKDLKVSAPALYKRSGFHNIRELIQAKRILQYKGVYPNKKEKTGHKATGPAQTKANRNLVLQHLLMEGEQSNAERKDLTKATKNCSCLLGTIF